MSLLISEVGEYFDTIKETQDECMVEAIHDHHMGDEFYWFITNNYNLYVIEICNGYVKYHEKVECSKNSYWTKVVSNTRTAVALAGDGTVTFFECKNSITKITTLNFPEVITDVILFDDALIVGIGESGKIFAHCQFTSHRKSLGCFIIEFHSRAIKIHKNAHVIIVLDENDHVYVMHALEFLHPNTHDCRVVVNSTDFKNIINISADGNYTVMLTTTKEILVTSSLSTWSKQNTAKRINLCQDIEKILIAQLYEYEVICYAICVDGSVYRVEYNCDPNFPSHNNGHVVIKLLEQQYLHSSRFNKSKPSE